MNKEQPKTIIGVSLIIGGIVPIVLGSAVSGIVKIVGAVSILVGAIVLMSKKHIDEDSLKGGWVGGDGGTKDDD